MTNRIEISTDTRRAQVPVTVYVRAFRKTTRTLAGQAVLSMLHAWGTDGASAAHAHLKIAAGDSMLYGNSLPVSVAS